LGLVPMKTKNHLHATQTLYKRESKHAKIKCLDSLAIAGWLSRNRILSSSNRSWSLKMGRQNCPKKTGEDPCAAEHPMAMETLLGRRRKIFGSRRATKKAYTSLLLQCFVNDWIILLLHILFTFYWCISCS
jgi:hypothetical protein